MISRAYDLELRKEMGVITRSEGLVTCMDFYKNTHLLCGTEKGDILVWKCKKWDQLKSLEGHKLLSINLLIFSKF